jgi:PUA domain protein
MADYRIRNRHRLQKKAVRKLSQKFIEVFDLDLDFHKSPVDSAEINNFEVFIIDNELIGLVIDGEPFLTIRGILRYKPTCKYVTVDMGAVKFVSNGADVMAPGIIDADNDITAGELVWVRDETHSQPLAIGRALMTSSEMIKNKSDKAVQSIHHVNDKLWNFRI